MLTIIEQRDSQGNEKPSEWSETTINKLNLTGFPLMALVSKSSILIMGGCAYGAVMLDTETLQVSGNFGPRDETTSIQELSLDFFRFEAVGN